jgi:hypothetical protein
LTGYAEMQSAVMAVEWNRLDSPFFFHLTFTRQYPTITYYWTVPLILDHLYLVGNLIN